MRRSARNKLLYRCGNDSTLGAKSQHSTRTQRSLPTIYAIQLDSHPRRGGDVHRKLGSIGHKKALAEPQPLIKLLTTHDTSNDCTWVTGFRPKNPSGRSMNSRHCSSYGELQVSHYFFCFASSPAGLQYYPRTRKRAEMDCFACIHSALTSFTSHEKQKWPTIKVTSLPGRLKSSTMKELIVRQHAGRTRRS
jgi:hypothetical protein